MNDFTKEYIKSQLEILTQHIETANKNIMSTTTLGWSQNKSSEEIGRNVKEYIDNKAQAVEQAYKTIMTLIEKPLE